ncbi:hypothetical protein N9K16_03060 [Alphaproteobacteria bacterium]|nr:hypothetical protein [Alphaproteobacteria bacterium]
MTNIHELNATRWRPVHSSLAQVGLDPDGGEYYAFEGGKRAVTTEHSVNMRNKAANDNAPSTTGWQGDRIEIKDLSA